jgi:hypothetical protein
MSLISFQANFIKWTDAYLLTVTVITVIGEDKIQTSVLENLELAYNFLQNMSTTSLHELANGLSHWALACLGGASGGDTGPYLSILNR